MGATWFRPNKNERDKSGMLVGLGKLNLVLVISYVTPTVQPTDMLLLQTNKPLAYDITILVTLRLNRDLCGFSVGSFLEKSRSG